MVGNNEFQLQQNSFMDRDILQALATWKESPFRKPLILKGARQVGKTAALKEFGRLNYDNVAYFSLEKIDAHSPSEYAQFFSATKDPYRIIANLSLFSGSRILPESTLIVFDEIQDCPAALKSLKYFCEDAPEYHVACAGSLLGIALASEDSFPVGKVSFAEVQPMTFSEFLRATGNGNLDQFARSVSELVPIPDAFAARYEEALRLYFAVGGMPEVVACWVAAQDMDQVNHLLSDLLDSYERDFAKHGGGSQFAKISAVWKSLPAQLARESKKFIYGVVREGARAREYEDAISWLMNAGLLHKVPRIKEPGLPLSAYEDEKAFKVYGLDVGLLRRMSLLDPSVFGTSEALFREFKGAFAENFIAQELKGQFDGGLWYWTNEKPKHEVDFVIQDANAIVPIEVKSGVNVGASSLRYYANKYPEQTPVRVRFSLRNLAFDGGVLNVPLYLANRATDLLRLALAEG